MTDTPADRKNMIAAIDVGTNSFHMVVATVSTRGVLRTVARNKEMVRLGAAAGDMKMLTEDAMVRGVRTLKQFVNEARAHNAHIRAIATSAVREAANKDEFLERVLKATGVEIEVVSGLEEGRLIYLGAMHALPILSKRALVFDIGGGSTETMIGYQGDTVYVNSTKLGHIRLSMRFFSNGMATPVAIEECRNAIRGAWSPVFHTLISYGFEEAIGCSGTIMALGAMTLARFGKRVPESLNGLRLSREDILATIESVATACTGERRTTLPGLDPKRADVILAGALILEQAILGLNIQEVTISSYALREGVVFDTVQQARDIKEYHHLSHLRYQSVDHLCDLFRVHRRHAEHVKNLCLRIFDDLRSVHGYTDKEREILEAAALLHDVGYHIAADQHHKHSEYIIRNSPMPGFTNDETELIASIARYHRKSHPRKKHSYFEAFSDVEQQLVTVLASILRICEGLDRRQQQIVQTVHAKAHGGSIDLILMAPMAIPDIEIWGAERRKSLMEQVLAKDVRILVNAQ